MNRDKAILWALKRKQTEILDLLGFCRKKKYKIYLLNVRCLGVYAFNDLINSNLEYLNKIEEYYG